MEERAQLMAMYGALEEQRQAAQAATEQMTEAAETLMEAARLLRDLPPHLEKTGVRVEDVIRRATGLAVAEAVGRVVVGVDKLAAEAADKSVGVLNTCTARLNEAENALYRAQRNLSWKLVTSMGVVCVAVLAANYGIEQYREKKAAGDLEDLQTQVKQARSALEALEEKTGGLELQIEKDGERYVLLPASVKENNGTVKSGNMCDTVGGKAVHKRPCVRIR